MRVVLLVTDLQPGGTPLRVLRWARWLPRIGVEPVVGCLAPRGVLCDRLDTLGIPNFSCDARHALDLGLFVRLSRALRRFDPDLLHAFLFHANVAARLVGRLDRPRPIVTSTATIEIERRWHRAGESLTAGRSDAHVVNSPRVARHVIDDLGFPPSRVVIVPNGVDIEALDATAAVDRAARGIPADVPLIAWAGRMDPIKRLDLWVEAFDRVRRVRPVCGVLVGDGVMRAAVEHDLRQRGLLSVQDQFDADCTGHVRLAGWTETPAAWMKAADVVLFPSDTEGNPNAVLEAMTAGCGVVASAVGGLIDTVRHGKNGLLCRPGDVDAFAAAVMAMCEKPAERSEMGRMARQRMQQTQDVGSVLSGLSRAYRTAQSHF